MRMPDSIFDRRIDAYYYNATVQRTYSYNSYTWSSIEERQQNGVTGAPYVMAIGGICAATVATYVYGRKKVITVVIILYLVPLLISASDLGPFIDYLGSLTNQFGQNMIPIMYSIYTTEVVDAKLRAFFFGLYFPATRIGTIISQLLPLPSKLAILCGLILIITALVLSVLAPETPYWLALVGRREEAQRVVEWLKDGPASAAESTYVFERAEYDAERKYTELVPIIRSRRFYIPIVLYLFAVLGSYNMCALFNAAGFRHANALGMDYSFIYRRVAADYTVIHFIRDVYFFLGCGLYQFLCLKMSRRRLFLLSMVLCLAFFWTNLAAMLGVAPFMVILHACEIFLHMGDAQINVMYPPEVSRNLLHENAFVLGDRQSAFFCLRLATRKCLKYYSIMGDSMRTLLSLYRLSISPAKRVT